MPERSLSCPRCQGSMEQGFVVDESYGRRMPAKWIEGAPQYWMWNVVVRGKRQLEIATYRCRRCGFLESYADEG
jgi:uncharacterized cupin superfamily protein